MAHLNASLYTKPLYGDKIAQWYAYSYDLWKNEWYFDKDGSDGLIILSI